MRTIEAVAKITSDGKLSLDAQIEGDFASGEYEAIVILDDEPKLAGERPTITFSAHDVGTWPEGLSLRREDIYGERGR